jgi:N-formylmaleamate deformylase
MARLYYGHVNTNNAKIHYYRTGDEKPPVVFLHGFSDNGLCWSRIAYLLERYYDVILVDARAHGFSEATEDGYSPEDRAADVAGLIEQLQLGAPPLVGHSMGADTAVFTAALYPKLVGSLILEDPPFWKDEGKETEESRQHRAERFHQQIIEQREKSLDELIEIGKNQHPNWDQTDLFQWGKSKQQVRMQALKLVQEKRESWQFYARQVKCPVLLITGDPDRGAIVTPEIAEEAKRMWRKSELVNIAGAGHNIRRDNFEMYYQAVKNFLRKQTKW